MYMKTALLYFTKNKAMYSAYARRMSQGVSILVVVTALPLWNANKCNV